VQIPRTDVVSGPDSPSTGPDASKGKGKVVTPFCSDDEVLFNDDHPM
jgi:hypothetical protein